VFILILKSLRFDFDELIHQSLLIHHLILHLSPIGVVHHHPLHF
jgi:hypothetical protein